MKRLLLEQILLLHSQLIAETGGSDGLRDSDLLDSALNAPFQTFDGSSLYPTLQQKAARLGYSLVNNHPFVDGNKRIGIHVMLVFLAINGLELQYEQSHLIEVGLALASGTMDDQALLRWILEHQQE